MKTKVALVGAGGISPVHLKALRQMDDVELTGICDIEFKNAQTRAHEFGGTPYADIEDMLDKEKPDAVWLTTPPTVRRDPIRILVERSIPVMCEKPAAHSLEEAEGTVRVIREHKGKVSIGYVYRHLSIIDRLKEHLNEDPPHCAVSFYVCPFTLHFIKGEPAASWFYLKDISGGGLHDQATHPLDLMRYLFGDAEKVSCIASNIRQPKQDDYTVEDIYSLNIAFKNKILVTHTHSWLHEKWISRMIIFCEKTCCTLELNEHKLTISGKEGEESFSSEENWYFLEDRRFIDMVKTGDFSSNRSTYEDAAKSLKLTCSALDSLEKDGIPIEC